jgi:hypothetical protein
MESRIITLYHLLDKNIMPWNWDYKNYSGENSDMIGFLYPEDYNSVIQIEQLKNAGEQRRAQQK